MSKRARTDIESVKARIHAMEARLHEQSPQVQRKRLADAAAAEKAAAEAAEQQAKAKAGMNNNEKSRMSNLYNAYV